MNTDAPIAESSPAPTESTPAPVVAPSLDRLTTEERQTWRKTGNLPDAKPADSSPATPDKAASTDATLPPASEPGTPKPKKNAESRIQELLADRHARDTRIAELERQLATPRPTQEPTQPAVSSPAPVGERFPDFDSWSAKQPEALSSYEDYIDARAAFVFEQKQQAHERHLAEAAAHKEAVQKLADYRKNAEKFVAERPDYWQVIAPVTNANVPKPVLDAIDGALARAEYPPQLLYHLGTHLDEFETLIALPPAQAAYELGQLSARLSAPAPPVVKTLSSAPPPPPTLGSKPASPVDDVEAAVKRGQDGYATYKLVMNKRAVAK